MESSRHVCKLCNKRFACGRSLGGHMRSHLTNNLAADTNDEKQSKSSLQLANYMEEEKDLDSFGFGYGLRKNPKKTQKLEFLSEESSHNDKFCRECGKEFQSWKALFGHMKCHSSSFEEPDSLITDPKQKLVMDIQSDNEMEAPNKRKRSTTRRTITNSEVEQEQEVAISLMLLSMDVGNWVGFNSPAESSDNNSKFLESKTSVSYGCDEFVKSNKLKGKKMIKSHKFSSDMFLKSQRKTLAEFWDSKIYKKIPKKRSKFECDICYKIFDSYQALGGHRASHKKLKGCLVESAIEEEEVDSESSLEVAISESKLDNGGRREGEIGSRIPTKMNKHKCPICERVFASGQALGGHKRSHLINGSEAKNRKAIVIQKQVPEIRGFLDLNLPPEAVERESKDHNLGSLKPWWVSASEHKHEALVNVGFHI